MNTLHGNKGESILSLPAAHIPATTRLLQTQYAGHLSLLSPSDQPDCYVTKAWRQSGSVLLILGTEPGPYYTEGASEVQGDGWKDGFREQ